jgi:imidazolonepropionase-like amidohydrolase
MRLLINAGTLIDSTGAAPQSKMSVVVEDGRISSIFPQGAQQVDDAQVIDVADSTLLPGLIDMHFHQFLLLMGPIGGTSEVTFRRDELIAAKILKAARAAKVWLQSGVTTIRDAGAGDNLAVAMKEAIEDGLTQGPRVIPSGSLIAQTGGLRSGNEDIAVEITGPVEARRVAREQLKAGVEVLKIYGASSIGGGGGRLVGPPGWPQLSVEEILAVTEEAHKANRLSSAHAVSTVSIKNVIRGGVDWVDHADFLDDEAIEMLLETKTPIVPTMAIGWSLEHFGVSMGFGQHIARMAAEVGVSSMEGLRKAYKAGVVIATGTDADNPRASVAQECVLLTQAGMSPMEAILAATRTPSRILRLEEKIGTVEEGKVADLLIVDGNPAENIEDLKRVRHVIQAGKPLSLPLVDLSQWGY